MPFEMYTGVMSAYETRFLTYAPESSRVKLQPRASERCTGFRFRPTFSERRCRRDLRKRAERPARLGRTLYTAAVCCLWLAGNRRVDTAWSLPAATAARMPLLRPDPLLVVGPPLSAAEVAAAVQVPASHPDPAAFIDALEDGCILRHFDFVARLDRRTSLTSQEIEPLRRLGDELADRTVELLGLAEPKQRGKDVLAVIESYLATRERELGAGEWAAARETDPVWQLHDEMRRHPPAGVCGFSPTAGGDKPSRRGTPVQLFEEVEVSKALRLEWRCCALILRNRLTRTGGAFPCRRTGRVCSLRTAVVPSVRSLLACRRVLGAETRRRDARNELPHLGLARRDTQAPARDESLCSRREFNSQICLRTACSLISFLPSGMEGDGRHDNRRRPRVAERVPSKDAACPGANPHQAGTGTVQRL